ncbi:MAG TPA: hypothetical protein VM580_24110, partial [Labilithrix sp.]|nr:hypothetical protein [Labilithrix sp.]
MSSKKIAVAIAVGLGAVGLVSLATWPTRRTSTVSTPTAKAVEPSKPLQCVFRTNDTAAFSFASTATLEGSGTQDLFEGVLSWVVVDEARDDRPALLRTALTSVVVEQTASEEQVNAAELVASPFYVRVDSSCRFSGLGFSPRWSGASRRLVTTLLESYEVVLPGDASARWEAKQRDSVGAYTGQYQTSSSVGPRLIVRTKPSYHPDQEARRMGIRVQLLGARAEARFDPARPGWLQQMTGRERVLFHLPEESPQSFDHSYRIERDDARYHAVNDTLSLDEADFSDARTAEPQATASSDPAIGALRYEAARARFNDFVRQAGRSGIYPAARFLAGWLRAHPEESERVLADLKSGAIDKESHSALFLALELAGTVESRKVLTSALTDTKLSELNRARAASALADHGEPTQMAASALLAHARRDSSQMIANVSLLGLGRLAARTRPGDPLRAELRSALEAELARATTDGAAVAVVDAMGNSGDDTFGPALEKRLRTGAPTMRARAAEALGHLSPEVARPHLV